MSYVPEVTMTDSLWPLNLSSNPWMMQISENKKSFSVCQYMCIYHINPKFAFQLISMHMFIQYWCLVCKFASLKFSVLTELFPFDWPFRLYPFNLVILRSFFLLPQKRLEVYVVNLLPSKIVVLEVENGIIRMVMDLAKFFHQVLSCPMVNGMHIFRSI